MDLADPFGGLGENSLWHFFEQVTYLEVLKRINDLEKVTQDKSELWLRHYGRIRKDI